jgi:Ku70/Ku80-like protein
MQGDTRRGRATNPAGAAWSFLCNRKAILVRGMTPTADQDRPCSMRDVPGEYGTREDPLPQHQQRNWQSIRMRRVDEGTGEEVPYEKIVSGYEVGKGQYIEVTDEELEAIALESTRTIDIDEFVPKKKIDQLYSITLTTSFRKARLELMHSR